MAETLGILGQSNPSAGVLTAAYTVGAGKTAAISSIVVANRSSTATSFRISIAKAGAADDPAQYIAYDVPINGNDSLPLKDFRPTLGAGDIVRVYAANATLSFGIFGVEVTA